MLVVLADGDDELSAQDAYDRLLDALDECDYLPRELRSTRGSTWRVCTSGPPVP